MNQDEARALAHLATVQSGFEADFAPLDRDRWLVTIRCPGGDVRVERPEEYVAWMEARRPKEPVPKWTWVFSVLRAIVWLVSGLVGAVGEGLGAVYAQDRSQYEIKRDVDSAISTGESRDYGYYLTHRGPPGR